MGRRMRMMGRMRMVVPFRSSRVLLCLLSRWFNVDVFVMLSWK